MLSVIVPVYNAEKTLNRCIASILRQEACGQEIEIILVNDGSTDNSGNLCDLIAQSHPHTVKVFHQENQGPSFARNKGIENAQGEWIVFVDGDDTIIPTTFAEIFKRQKENDSQLVVYGYNNVTDGKVSKVSFGDEFYVTSQDMAKDFQSLYVKFFFNSVCNKLYMRELITHKFLTDKDLGEDLIFNMEYLQNCYKIDVMPQCFYNYIHDNEKGLTLKYREDKFSLALEVYHYIENIGKTWIGEQYENSGNNSILIGDTMRTIQRYVQCVDHSFIKQHKTVAKLVNDKTVQEAVKDMYTEDFVFKALQLSFKMKLVTIPILAFRLQKLI